MSTIDKAKALQKYQLEDIYINPKDLVIVTDKNHPLYQERATWPVNQELVAAIQSKGFTSKVLVGFDGKDYVVIAGRQRTKAAVAAKLPEIPAVSIGDITNLPASELMVLMTQENELRKDNNSLEKAEEAQRLYNQVLEEAKPANWPGEIAWKPSAAQRKDAQVKVAEAFGLSTSRISKMIALLDEDKTNPKLVEAIKKDEVSFKAALALGSRNPIEQGELLEKLQPVFKQKAAEHTESGGKRPKAVSGREAEAIVGKAAKVTVDRSWLEKCRSRRSCPPDVKDFIKELLNPGSVTLPYIPGNLEPLKPPKDLPEDSE